MLLLSRNRSFLDIDLLSIVAANLGIDHVERLYSCEMFASNAEMVLDSPQYGPLVTVYRYPVVFRPVLQMFLSLC